MANQTDIITTYQPNGFPQPTQRTWTDIGGGSVAENVYVAGGTTTLTGPLPAGSNVIGGVTVADGSDVTQGAKADAAYAGSGSASVVATLKGLYAACVAATPAGTNIIGSILGRTSRIMVTPTVTASSAYTAGYEVGGLMTFSNVFGSADSGILQSIRVKCKSVQTTGLKLYLFTTNPTNSTWTDKAAPAINAADIAGLTGPFALSSPDSGLGTETTWELDGIGAAYVSDNTNLYGVLVCTGTPTFTSTSDVSVSLVTLQD